MLARMTPHRRSIRLAGHDYSSEAMYFVTVCTFDRVCSFGEIVNGEVHLNDAGRIVQTCWTAIPDHFAHVTLDEWVVMPNHVHGILAMANVATPVGARDTRATHASPLPGGVRAWGPRPHSVGAIVGSFKSAVTKRINEMRGTPGAVVWQRNYYDRIIADIEALDRMREYIANNPANWATDPDR